MRIYDIDEFLQLKKHKLLHLVTELWFVEQGLSKFPLSRSDMRQMPNITHICLCSNQLTEIPPSLFECMKVKGFCVNNNSISSIPKEIYKWKYLRELFLNYNDINSIDNIYSNINLVELGLAYNTITTIPDEINKLENLQIIELEGNPVDDML